ncbi:MAG: DUF4340 domain-containing protein [Verrucomicrobiota bacterium]
MKKRQVIILWVIALALGAAVTAVKLSQNESTQSATKRAAGQTLFESFPANDASTVEIQGAANTVTLVKKDGKWVVVQRDNYPANSTFVNDFIRTLGELKITLGMEAGPSFAPRFGMDETAAKPEDRGLTATFKDAAGKEIAKVSLGKNIESGGAASPMGMGGNAVGRYIRNHADDSGFYAVGEMFPSVSDEAKRWLSDGFVSPEKIKSITVSQVGKTDPAWKLTRDTEEAEFKLDGAGATEVPDTAVTGPLKSLFSYARFEDVVPASKVGERIAEGKRTAILETFEGFIYTVAISPTKPSAAPAAPAVPGAEPAATDNFLVTVDVAAELPKERRKEDGEKPEDAKAKDDAFTERHKALTEKLAKEKALAGITFEVAKSTVEPLLKDRDGLLTKEKAAAPAAPANAGLQQFPGGMIARPPVSATTPPISVPSVEEVEDDSEEGE